MNFRFEKNKISHGYTHIIGCDEVGRGCLAGPVVAAAVIMKHVAHSTHHEIRDSKQLSAKQREKLDIVIKENSLWSIGVVSEEVVDEINIHNATLLAMRKAVEGLFYKGKAFLYIDGQFVIPNLKLEQEAVVGGDNKILSIAAASIIAKVYRDDLMRKLHLKYPIYNFAQHKGYGTLFHRTMIMENGLSPIHRRSFCSNFIH